MAGELTAEEIAQLSNAVVTAVTTTISARSQPQQPIQQRNSHSESSNTPGARSVAGFGYANCCRYEMHADADSLTL